MFGIRLILFSTRIILFNKISIKLFNKKGKKEKIALDFRTAFLKNAPKVYVFSIDTKGKYGLSINTLKYILDLFFGEYIIFAQKLFHENKLKKMDKNNFYIDMNDYNAIISRKGIEYLFFNRVAEHYYLIPLKGDYLDEKIYKIAKSTIDYFEGGKESEYSIKNGRIMEAEDCFYEISILYLSLEDLFKDAKNISLLIKYFDDNDML